LNANSGLSIIFLAIYHLKSLFKDFKIDKWFRKVFGFYQEKQEREETERKRHLQMYVFVLRCVAYPFNCKQPQDLGKRHLKVTREGLEKMRARIEVINTSIKP